MNIKYLNKKNLNPKSILELYKSVGWAKNNSGERIAKIHKNSNIVISAWDDKKLVGVIRGLTDKIQKGVIFGLAVKKKYQKKGIGRNLLIRLTKEYKNVKWHCYSQDKKLDNYYKNLKFKKEKHTWFYKGESPKL